MADLSGTVERSVQVQGTLSAQGTVSGTVTPRQSMSGGLGVGNLPQIPGYPGPYSVTPDGAGTTLSTAGRVLQEDVVISPIPAGWGKITWNGGTLHVS